MLTQPKEPMNPPYSIRTAWRNAICADTHREYGRYALSLLLKGLLTRRTFRVVVTMRLCQGAASAPWSVWLLLPALQLAHHIAARRAGIDLSWRTSIGPGFKLTHGWGTVVNPAARIGRNVTLFHGVTLGRRDHVGDDGERRIAYPTLEDEVWCGPHAIVVGGVTVGQGSRISGGAFVTTDIPAFSVVVGNPAVIVKTGCSPAGLHFAPVCSRRP